MQCHFLQEQVKIQIPFEWSYEKKVAKSYWKINICASYTWWFMQCTFQSKWYYNRILHLNYKNNNGNCVRRTLTLKVMLSVLLITQTGSRTRQHNYEFNGVWVNRTDEAWRHLPLAWRWKNPIVPWDRQYDSPYFINTLVNIFSFKSPDLIARDCFISHFTIIHVKKLKNIF